MIKKASDVKLNVLPLLISVEHLYYYEGPCRFGKGDALQPGYDRLANAQKQEQFLNLLKDHLPEGCEMMDPVTLSRTDDWENPEAQWDAIAPAVAACDIIVAQTGIACDDRAVGGLFYATLKSRGLLCATRCVARTASPGLSCTARSTADS